MYRDASCFFFQGYGSASDDEIKSYLGRTSDYLGRTEKTLLFIK